MLTFHTHQSLNFDLWTFQPVLLLSIMKVKDKLQPSDKALGDPPGLIEHRAVYDGLKNIDSEFYPRKMVELGFSSGDDYPVSNIDDPVL